MLQFHGGWHKAADFWGGENDYVPNSMASGQNMGNSRVGGHSSAGDTRTVSGVCFKTMGLLAPPSFSLDKALHLVLGKAELSVFQG